MSFVILALLLCLFNISHIQCSDKIKEACIDPNTTYYECLKNKATCEDPYPLEISKECQSGCFCKEGLVSEQGKCIKWCDCPKPECGPNEEFKECSLCGRTCGNYFLNIMFKCICKPGCACKAGFVETDDKECVKIEECPADEVHCPDDMYYGRGELELTCDHPKRAGRRTNGCFCKDGRVYHRDSLQCVHIQECPGSEENLKCKAEDPGKEFKICQPEYSWVCGEENNPRKNSVENCTPGCYCNPLFHLNNTGFCVYSHEC